MDDIKNPIEDVKSTLADKTDAATEHLTGAADLVSNFADNGLGQVEEKITEFTDKTDTVIGALENFFKKF